MSKIWFVVVVALLVALFAACENPTNSDEEETYTVRYELTAENEEDGILVETINITHNTTTRSFEDVYLPWSYTVEVPADPHYFALSSWAPSNSNAYNARILLDGDAMTIKTQTGDGVTSRLIDATIGTE